MLATLLTQKQAGFPTPEALEAFVRTYGRGGICYRTAETFQRAIETGVLVAILVEGEVIAMSGVLPLSEGKFEVGGALVRADYTGFGLQAFMLEARFAAVERWGVGPWTKIYTGAALADYGAGSRGNVEAMRFEPIPYEDGPLELREECQTCTKPRPAGRVCCYQFYRAGAMGPEFTYSPGRRLLTNRRDARELELDLPQIS
ncbi:MAG: hypothetical protein GYB36_02210 [Alphaproteobacteria bacterium]|nr:hypothetical protein [Alphaproteobacteria bacterium]